MTIGATLARRSVSTGYVVGAAVVTAAASLLSQAGLVPDWVVIAGVILYLGPLGLAALLVVLVPISFLVVAPNSVVLGLSVAVAMGVAVLNVLIVRRWSTGRGSQAGTGGAGMTRRVWDQVLGAVLFVFAGCVFILLSMIAGFEAMVAPGVDVRVPVAEADHVRLLAALTWWPGLTIAVGGLVLWIVCAKRARPILPWAIVDLVLMLGLVTVLWQGTS